MIEVVKAPKICHTLRKVMINWVWIKTILSNVLESELTFSFDIDVYWGDMC